MGRGPAVNPFLALAVGTALILGLLALSLGVIATVSVARAWADDRARERDYANQWCDLHKDSRGSK